LLEADRLRLAFMHRELLVYRAASEIGEGEYALAARTLAATDSRSLDEFYVLNRASTFARLHIATLEPERAIAAMDIGVIRNRPAGMYAEFLATRSLAYACAREPHVAEEIRAGTDVLELNVEARVLHHTSAAIAKLVRHEIPDLEPLLQAVKETGNVDSLICGVRGFPGLARVLRSSQSAQALLGELCDKPGGSALAGELGLERRFSARPPLRSLSQREREVLELVCAGFRNREIATRLYISPKTVKTHLQNIYQKLGVKSRTEAAMWASRNLS
jgi:DNA-binding CsgD family transcriptional regulator/nucleotide-binding universal stress UspA family protein